MIFVNLDIQIFENLLTRMIENLDIGIFVCELFVMRRSWFVPLPPPPSPQWVPNESQGGPYGFYYFLHYFLNGHTNTHLDELSFFQRMSHLGQD